MPFGRPVPARSFDPDALGDAKARAGLGVSVVLPARNEEATVGHIVATVRRTLVERRGLVDEILVMDDGSTDATREAAAWEGARVVDVDAVLPEEGRGSGKGNALWRSVYVAEGDLLVWIDADVRNFGPHFVTGLLGPLLTNPAIGFVKGCYRRPFHGEPTGGGRVTELMARPVLSHLFPSLARIVQPLAGEYAARRDVVEQLPFVEGWGVELGLLIDVAERFGMGAIEQVDLDVREHRNRPIEELGAPALAILVTALRRAGIDRSGLDTEELVRYGDGQVLERVDVATGERPPMLSLAAYRAKFGRSAA